MKKTGMMIAAVLAWCAVAWGAVRVTNVSVQQQEPWNGLVDIDYEVVSDDATADVNVQPIGYDGNLGRMVAMENLSGDGAEGPVKPGPHRMTWNMGEENPDFDWSAFSVKFLAISEATPYMVMDMSEGIDAETWPVSYVAGPGGEGEWTDEYKTSNLVMRLILPGTFTMGSPADEPGRAGNETQHEVTVSKPFYMGVFEVTQKQWELAMGTTPSRSTCDTRPVERVSYKRIRGKEAGTNGPTDEAGEEGNPLAGFADRPTDESGAKDSPVEGETDKPTDDQVDAGHPLEGETDNPTEEQAKAMCFMEVVRAKTGLAFDLPTEAQWEYACRAGTTSALNSGKDLTGTGECANMAEVGRYSFNQSDGEGGYSLSTTVGRYLPNAWGLYDMHGNVWEWCLDWYGDYVAEAGTDPTGAESGVARVRRGGGWGDSARGCRSASRAFSIPSYKSGNVGFRLACSAGL